MPKSQPSALEHIKAIVAELEEKKATEIKAINVSETSSVTDYFIVATGNSEPQLRALSSAVQRYLKEANIDVLGVEAGDESGWIVVDAFHFIIHLFLPEQRDAYRLAQLWKDGELITLE